MNLTVLTPDEQLMALAKPNMGTVERFLIEHGDLLVICAGFEDRALAILENAASEATSFNVLLINYEPHIPQNRAGDIRTICHNAGLPIVELTYNRQEPSGFGDTFLKTLSRYEKRIFIDVSAMSRILIVQILVALGTRDVAFNNSFVAYAEADIYPPSKAEAEVEYAKGKEDPTFSILFLSSGVFEVTIIPELSSFAPAGPQTRLIAFPTFDAHQLSALCAEIQPSRFSFIEGISPSSQNVWRQGMIAQVNCLDQIQDSERYQTSTQDYHETLDCLLDLYTQYACRERLLIAPTGSKMQTVAVGLFRAFIRDVQIVYPTPVSFLKPDAYTHGIGPIHLLPLEDFQLSNTD